MGTAHSGTWRMPVTATYIQLATSEIPLHLAINPFFFTARQTDFFIFSPFVLFSAFCLWRSKAFRRHAAAVTFRPELETFCKHRTKIFGRPSKQEFFRRLSSPTLSFLPLLPLRKARLTWQCLWSWSREGAVLASLSDTRHTHHGRAAPPGHCLPLVESWLWKR